MLRRATTSVGEGPAETTRRFDFFHLPRLRGARGCKGGQAADPCGGGEQLPPQHRFTQLSSPPHFEGRLFYGSTRSNVDFLRELLRHRVRESIEVLYG